MTAPAKSIEELRDEALAGLAVAADEAAIEAWRADWLGEIPSVLR